MSGPVRIGVVGAAGRMGLEIVRAAAARDDVEVGSAVEHSGSPLLGTDIGAVAGLGPMGVKILAGACEAVEAVDVMIDLSLPEATADVVEAAVRARRPLVCGTTGLDSAAMDLLDRAAASIPLLYTTNLSPGIAVMTELLSRAVDALGESYDIEIVEMHHRNKVDAPSGTALSLASAAARAASFDDDPLVHGRSGKTGVRPARVIGIHAVRGGGVFGDHTAILAGAHERIEITHRAGSRALFAEGAIRAALFLADAPVGRHTMADVLGLRANSY